MSRGIIIGLVIIILIAGGAYYAYYYFTTGNVSIYLQDAPSSQGLKIYLTISSIMIHKVNSASNGSWILVSNKSITVLLTSNITFLASARLPAGQYNEIFLEISSAKVELGGVNISANLPSAVFKIHIVNGMDLKGGSSESLLISFPHITFSNGEIIISPSVTAQVISQ
ncbi:DUF4382 domain-containing protein [Sulfolobus tengchongensis]|uniref:DUF4382 domain-containing protein n=1 Tax=Sulfolobus tengchongensis TaxID=207809 RepID=A0AAX4L4N8_9CREN